MFHTPARGAGLVESLKFGEIEIAPVHDVEGTGFPDQLVEDVYVVNTAQCDNDDEGSIPFARSDLISTTYETVQ
jgi:hypothetical protein